MRFRLLGVLGIVLFASVLLVGCGNKTTQEVSPQETTNASDATAQESEQASTARPFVAVEGDYIVQTDQSSLRWEGKGVGKSMKGTVALASGSLSVDDIAVSKGSFVIDMASMEHDGGSERLIGHLSSDDFFSIETYPESRFVFTGMQRLEGDRFTVTGNLTIKDETHTIQIPAVITSIENGYRATARFDIDRTRWGVRFGSDNFFDNLGDTAIDDMIAFDLDLVAISQASIENEQK